MASAAGDACIVRLSNMVKRDELLDETEYQEILEVRGCHGRENRGVRTARVARLNGS